MAPVLKSIDHVHVFVSDRKTSENWYRETLGFERTTELEFWAPNGGPLTVQNKDGSIHLALFERSPEKCRSTIALGSDASAFLLWKKHLQQHLLAGVEAVDHEVSWSLYFNDPDGNPFEITTYEYQEVKRGLARGEA